MGGADPWRPDRGLRDRLHARDRLRRKRQLPLSNFTEYLIPTAVETPRWELDRTVTPSPHHPLGAKGVGEAANVGSPAAFVNAVVDALSHLGVRHIDMPITPWKIWKILREHGITE